MQQRKPPPGKPRLWVPPCSFSQGLRWRKLMCFGPGGLCLDAAVWALAALLVAYTFASLGWIKASSCSGWLTSHLPDWLPAGFSTLFSSAPGFAPPPSLSPLSKCLSHHLLVPHVTQYPGVTLESHIPTLFLMAHHVPGRLSLMCLPPKLGGSHEVSCLFLPLF